MGEGRVQDREVRAMLRAMEETDIKNGLIVAYEDEGEIKKNSSVITIVPAYNFLLICEREEGSSGCIL